MLYCGEIKRIHSQFLLFEDLCFKILHIRTFVMKHMPSGWIIIWMWTCSSRIFQQNKMCYRKCEQIMCCQVSQWKEGKYGSQFASLFALVCCCERFCCFMNSSVVFTILWLKIGEALQILLVLPKYALGGVWHLFSHHCLQDMFLFNKFVIFIAYLIICFDCLFLFQAVIFSVVFLVVF